MAVTELHKTIIIALTVIQVTAELCTQLFIRVKLVIFIELVLITTKLAVFIEVIFVVIMKSIVQLVL